ncbi:MAG: rhodanese-like domain-containing protein [Bacteroidota bacterium]|nr:rhodanese-like domain-containing protein [Bacteroidota bacterium]
MYAKKKNEMLMLTVAFLLALLSSCQSQTNNKQEVEPQKNESMKNMEIIVDVRSPEEWEFDGHANCSVNYPLDEIKDKVEDLKKYEHIVLVCRTGNRAGVAKRILEQAGLKNIENKGPWQNAVCPN